MVLCVPFASVFNAAIAGGPVCVVKVLPTSICTSSASSEVFSTPSVRVTTSSTATSSSSPPPLHSPSLPSLPLPSLTLLSDLPFRKSLTPVTISLLTCYRFTRIPLRIPDDAYLFSVDGCHGPCERGQWSGTGGESVGRGVRHSAPNLGSCCVCGCTCEGTQEWGSLVL